MKEFDAEKLARELNGISSPMVHLFAAAVSERLYPAAVEFFSSHSPASLRILRDALDAVWAWDGSSPQASASEETMLPQCMAAMDEAVEVAQGRDEFPLTGVQRRLLQRTGTKALHLTDDETNSAFFAENAAAAIAYALLGIARRDVQKFAWAAQRAYDSVDRRALHLEQQSGASWNEDELLRHPIVQQELSRQLEDVRHLKSASTGVVQMIASHMKDRSQRQAASVFSVES